jgi:hypothetical protein
MILVERFCQCGEKLRVKAINEDEARQKLEEFLTAHIGRELDGTVHAMMKGRPWRIMMKRLREQMKASVEAQANQILEEGRLAPNTRRYKIR